MMSNETLLKGVSFGAQVAEEEVAQLQDYFVKTDQWTRILNGDIDIIRGDKGAGKSALYLLLEKNRDELLARNTFVVSAEKPRGTTVFRDLISDPPTAEPEFIVLWKLYLITLIAHTLRDSDLGPSGLNSVYGALEEAGLLERELNLTGLLRAAQSLARRLLKPKTFETEVSLDPVTGSPTGIIGRISLAEPSSILRERGIFSVDGLFERINAALVADRRAIWVLLDRLDVAFAESHELEANALRALIRVYGDLRDLEAISLKIFIREDIWGRITAGGFREASHITRFQITRWTNPNLLNLIMRRILSNETICQFYGVDKEEVLSDFTKQEELFAKIFPSQIEQGPQKATTFNWMVTRCADGTGKTAPRELIHLLNSVRDEEIRRLERGGSPPPNGQLFDRSVFKAALPTVSETRLNTYLFAEYPKERPLLEKLKGQKTEQNIDSLGEIWGVNREESLAAATRLVELGFFEQRGTRSDPSFWVPFLYRDGLTLVQGRADPD